MTLSLKFNGHDQTVNGLQKLSIKISIVVLSHVLQLPTSKSATKSHFNECLSEAVHGAIRQLNKPMEEYGLPSFEPFFLGKLLRLPTGLQEL
jgi:hypothetical protein